MMVARGGPDDSHCWRCDDRRAKLTRFIAHAELDGKVGTIWNVWYCEPCIPRAQILRAIMNANTHPKGAKIIIDWAGGGVRTNVRTEFMGYEKGDAISYTVKPRKGGKGAGALIVETGVVFGFSLPDRIIVRVNDKAFRYVNVKNIAPTCPVVDKTEVRVPSGIMLMGPPNSELR